MSGDIVERLRRWDDGRISTHWAGCMDTHPECAIVFAADAIEARDAEIERLRAEVSMLRAAMAALDAFHRPIYDDDIDSLTSGDRFCAVDDEAWPCSTHRLLHPAEASRDEGIKQDCVKDRSRLCVSWQTCGMSEECYYDFRARKAAEASRRG